MKERRELMEVIPETESCRFYNEMQQRMCVSLVKIDRQDFQKEIGVKDDAGTEYVTVTYEAFRGFW